MPMNIAELVEFDKTLNKKLARYLRGPSGIGKTSVVHMIAEYLKKEVFVINLAEWEPGDFVGFPYIADEIDSDGAPIKVTKFAAPWWWHKLENKILFLDETDRARPEIRPLAMRLALARMVADRKLPESTIIWAAGNGAEYATSPMDQAEVTRHVMVDFAPSVQEWLTFANKVKLHPMVIEFISANNAWLDTPGNLIGKEDVVVPSRRTWTMFGEYLRDLNHPNILEDIGVIVKRAASFVGYDVASEWASWLEKNYKPLTNEDIFSGKIHNPLAEFQISQLAASIENVLSVLNQEDYSEKDNVLNAARFYRNCGTELYRAFFAGLSHTHAPTLINSEMHEFTIKMLEDEDEDEEQSVENKDEG